VDGEPSAGLLARLGGAGSPRDRLAITSDDELTAIVGRGEPRRR
jgi:hypothetical protein